MKKYLFLSLLAYCSSANAQTQLDNYFNGQSNFTEIANNTHGLGSVQDLDFVPGRPGELWVVNKETFGGSVVIFFNAGKPDQSHQFRRDSHHDHFMPRVVALAFGDNDYFVTAQEVKNTAAPSSTFMGPCLWDSDTSVFARMHQNNWVPGELLGSHIDMLHQSPFGMGVAHDHDNVYWYFDGHNGNICKYDFANPHGVGEDDHSDGRIHRYTDVQVVRKNNIPSHMILDKANNWLYIVDAGNSRVIRMKTNTGTVGATLPVPATGGEPLAEYKEVTGATVEVLNTPEVPNPTGIDYKDGRIIVSDYLSGNIVMYDVTGSNAVYKGTLITGGPGVFGVRIADDNKIWYVNQTTKKLMRIDNPNVTSITNTAKPLSYAVYPNPATEVINVRLDELKGEATIRIFDGAGRLVHSARTNDKLTSVSTMNWAKGMYTISIEAGESRATHKVVLQ